jgi:hypothetical protein
LTDFRRITVLEIAIVPALIHFSLPGTGAGLLSVAHVVGSFSASLLDTIDQN